MLLTRDSLDGFMVLTVFLFLSWGLTGITVAWSFLHAAGPRRRALLRGLAIGGLVTLVVCYAGFILFPLSAGAPVQVVPRVWDVLGWAAIGAGWGSLSNVLRTTGPTSKAAP